MRNVTSSFASELSDDSSSESEIGAVSTLGPGGA